MNDHEGRHYTCYLPVKETKTMKSIVPQNATNVIIESERPDEVEKKDHRLSGSMVQYTMDLQPHISCTPLSPRERQEEGPCLCDCLGLGLVHLGLGLGWISSAWEKLQQCLSGKEKAWVLMCHSIVQMCYCSIMQFYLFLLYSCVRKCIQEMTYCVM
ncbi:uncharacterized protein LOC123396466 [Hordeum vulgare subsp. vulgare]|uniref:uncharacterized protein LOC123396466 n=1 Tax=Hordeum vulgare subsp. vulgare TaxID=112509 RepID=UPI001D1A4320|nr:uncharacterized protein LOC123396466 [Hordeum vulgare subsp. vulgare]